MAKTRSPVKRATKRSTVSKTRGTRAKKSSAPRLKARARSAASALTATAKAVGRTVSRRVGEAATAVAARMRRRGGSEDAIDLLEADHRRLETLLKDGEETTARGVKRRADILKRITAELTVHELIEEKVLYPVLKPHAKAKEIVLEGYQEHHVADVLLKELHGLRPSNERWGAKFKVFKENIEHHIKEEEGEMFKTARSVLGREQLQELGALMRAMKAGTRA